MTYLDDSFIERYNKSVVPFGGNGLGHFIYLRTYSRWRDDDMRRETWAETVRRVVEYSMKLYDGPATREELEVEAEYMFDTMFNLRLFPAGRTLWIGGTEAERRFGSANFNCAFTVVNKVEAFVEAFHLLMVGAGVGFRVLADDVNKLPRFNTAIAVSHKPYHGKIPTERIEETLTFEDDEDKDNVSVLIVVGDSKSGWVNALSVYLQAMQRDDVESIVINYDSVRPQGEKLKTFGGRASGHSALKKMFRAIHKVIRSSKGKLSPLHAIDILNHIGANVVVGGVRRTSEIALFGANDTESLNAKVDLWTEGSANYGNDQRSMSNNSIFFDNKPTKETLLDIFSRILNNGEPGFVNAEAARKRRPNFSGLNPCAEILLADRGVCNLTEVNLMAFIHYDTEGNAKVNHEALIRAVELATRIGLRQTNVTLDLPEWDKIQKRDRLTGVSLSGIMEFEAALGWKDKEVADWKTHSISAELAVLLDDLHFAANQEAIRYAKEMRVPTPLLVTTIKPSGTISKLPMISSGAHRSRSPYYIRRVRITSSDPLAKVMLDAGYPVYPSVVSGGPTESQLKLMKPFELAQELQKSSTWVIEFPIKSNTTMRSSDESAISQFGRYLDLQHYWTDHNTSITIEFSPDEVDVLVNMLLEHWDEYVAVSFMPKNTTAYPQLPEEPITEEEYYLRAGKLAHINDDQIIEALKELERDNLMSDLLDADCTSGACPVR